MNITDTPVTKTPMTSLAVLPTSMPSLDRVLSRRNVVPNSILTGPPAENVA